MSAIDVGIQKERDRIEEALGVCLCELHLPLVKAQLDGYVALSQTEPFERIDVEDDEFIRPAHVYLADDLPWIANATEVQA